MLPQVNAVGRTRRIRDSARPSASRHRRFRSVVLRFSLNQHDLAPHSSSAVLAVRPSQRFEFCKPFRRVCCPSLWRVLTNGRRQKALEVPKSPNTRVRISDGKQAVWPDIRTKG
jgi:hypothetical protein